MELKKEFAKLGNDNALFYVTLDPERAFGLEDILPNYTIVCPYKSKLVETLCEKYASLKMVILEEYLSEKEVESIVDRGTYGILQSDFFQEYLKTNLKGKTAYVMVLKNSQLIEDLSRKHGWRLLAPKAEIAEKFENKISQYRLLKDIAPYPPILITSFSEINKITTGILDSKFVLQFNRGHSGNSTFFIKSKKDFDKLAKKFPKREVKISQFINGKTYTLNCVVLSKGEVITGSISEQITGLKEATNNPNTTCGNDWTSSQKLKEAQIVKIAQIAKDIGKVLHKNGYKGLFGIDVIIEKRTGEVYFIELNTHQPASISFEASLHRKIGKMPLLTYTILDYVGRPTSHIGGKPPLILTIPAKQVIYRNKTKQVLTKDYIEEKYGSKGLTARVKYIKPNEEIYRVQKLNVNT